MALSIERAIFMRNHIRSGVYQIVNEINGESYVGSSKNIDNRWIEHRRSFTRPMKNRSLLRKAVLGFGIENFTFLILEECELIKETLLAREQHYIDTLKPAYNLMPKAGSRLGSKQSAEAIERQKKRMKAYVETPEWHEQQRRMLEAVQLYMNDPDVKQKYCDLRKGKTFEEIFGEDRAADIAKKIGENRTPPPNFVPWNKGIPITEEQKALLFAGGDVWREQHGSWNKGMKMSEEHCQLMAEITRRRWETDPEFRRRVLESGFQKGQDAWNKGVPMSEEQLLANTERAKAWHEANPDHQVAMTEAARIHNSGRKYPDEHCKAIGDGRRGKGSSAKGRPRPAEVVKRIADAQRGKPREYLKGKPNVNSKSGHYGISWRKDTARWNVRIEKKKYGSFATIEEALKRRDDVIQQLGR